MQDEKLTDQQMVAEIEKQIREQCSTSKYQNLCMRTSTDAGMAYVINRCVVMMANDHIKLSTVLATLEAEMEGMD